MAVIAIIECFRRDHVPEYCQCLESSAVCTAHPFFVESIHSRSNWSLPRLPLRMDAEDIIPTFVMSNIYIGLCLPNALMLTRLWSYRTFEGLLIARINNCVGLLGILNVQLLRDSFPYRLGRGIPLKVGVRYRLQSKGRTPPPDLCWPILALQISLNACHLPCSLHNHSQ
jgi:hypothetical protein